MTKIFKETLVSIYTGNNAKQLPSCSEQLDELIKDAERYRFIRQRAYSIKMWHGEHGKEHFYTLEFKYPCGGNNKGFDSSIDGLINGVKNMLTQQALNKLSASERELLGL